MEEDKGQQTEHGLITTAFKNPWFDTGRSFAICNKELLALLAQFLVLRDQAPLILLSAANTRPVAQAIGSGLVARKTGGRGEAFCPRAFLKAHTTADSH